MKNFKFLLTVVVLFLSFGIFGANVSYAADTYYVQKGDSLWKISKKYQIGLSEIIDANSQIPNPDLIYPGQKITIPNIDRTKSIESEVLRLTNVERAKYGLPALRDEWQLARVARYKSADMRDKGYFSHTSPTYGSPFTMMKNFNIQYSAAAENIAAGQSSAAQVVQDWMNSEGHRKNILNGSYTHLGVGYAKGGAYGHYWTQMFIKK
ncbi:SafA/ExsA family spore coat assembly protein [Bacillus sp. 2205SS5-2]|uniref:SafA/ExsA family spore coat assembly protein n=1 Tax=Bacillus sp. 2205SS5-2 TaxID=3109031 RepID=UPI003005E62C